MNLARTDVKLADDWATAYARAKAAGFRGFGDAEEAYSKFG
jgi:hypothetical protein